MDELAGKVAVVLGASAEQGTGWQVAKQLAERGARVVVGARSFDKLRALAETIGAIPVACDAGDEAQVEALAARALAEFGRIDIAVNSAGYSVMGTIAEAEQTNLDFALRLNYLGQVYFIKHTGRRMADGGSIAIISSLVTDRVQLPHFAYACAKAATECLVRYAAVEFGARGIRVNAIQPGPIDSDLAREHLSVPGVREVYLRETPLRRVAEPADLADAVLWLSGRAFITGHSLPVCGGLQLTRFPYPDELPGGEGSYGDIKSLFDR